MNRKQLIILLVFGLVIGGLGIWAIKQRNASYEDPTGQMGKNLIPSFPLNDIAQLTIKQRSGELNVLKNKDELWVVKERGEYPANFSTIRELLIKISELKIAKPVNVGPSRLPQLELTPPDQGPSTLVQFKDAKGKEIKSLLLGAKHVKNAGDSSPYGGGSWPDGRYVMVGNDIKTISLVSDAMTSAEPKPEDWLNKDWFKVEKLRSISVTATNATNNWKLSRDSETNEWKLADVKAGEQPDSTKFSSVTSALSSPSFNDVTTNAPTNALSAVLETTDGFTYNLKFASKSGGDDYLVKVAVSGAFQKERTPGKDEKPEDKTKLDKEFTDKIAKLNEKLKTEKAYEKWTYVVSKWTIDALLKERKDLLQEKKEEKKDDTKPAAGVTTPVPAPGNASAPLMPETLSTPVPTPPPPPAPASITNTVKPPAPAVTVPPPPPVKPPAPATNTPPAAK